MEQKKRTSRRDFLKGAILAGAGLLLGNRMRACPTVPDSIAQGATASPRAYLPLVMKESTPTSTATSTPTSTPSPTPTTEPAPPGTSTVIHVHNPSATNWDGNGWYGNAVDQSVVNSMVQSGLQELTGKSSWGDIWYELFKRVNASGYQPGQKIAIKVNFNNSHGNCSDSDNEIDALPHPVKALIAGLVAAGVNQNDIWIYDATVTGRAIPARFRDPILSTYSSVAFYGSGDCSGVNPVSHGGHSSLTVHFSDPHGYLSDRLLTDVLYSATYLINMPIIKGHGIHPVSLGFKNHFGSLNNIIRGENDNLHRYISPSDSLYSSTYSPLVDIFSNPNIRDKTILTVGDALYGAFGATFVPPTSWNSFGDAPNSLLFSTDPVAIDCVMIDLLVAEGRVGDNAYHYLFVAQDAGLGVCEGTRSDPGGDPWQTPYGSGYSKITYRRI